MSDKSSIINVTRDSLIASSIVSSMIVGDAGLLVATIVFLFCCLKQSLNDVPPPPSPRRILVDWSTATALA